MNEIWKDIKGYEKYYQVSNKGRIKSLPRLKIAANNFVTKEKILKLVDNSRGYLRVNLKANGKNKVFFVHRLVAEHFLKKIDGCNVVNHLDCNPHNNNVENLEWTTLKGNSEYMCKLNRNKRTKIWIERLTQSQRTIKGKQVIGIEIKGNKVLKYSSLNQVKKDGFQPSCVSNCCNKKRLTHKGFVWRFKDE